MRKLFAFAFIIISSTSFAQNSEGSDTEINFLPQQGDWGASILIDGLIDNINLRANQNEYGQNILFAKYYIKDRLVLRTGLGLNVNRYKREMSDSVGSNLEETDSLINSYLINISAGIEKHFTPGKRLDPFIFAQMDLTFIGKNNIEVENRVISSVGTGTSSRTIKQDGGIAFGLQLGGGFNYFLAKRFSLGAELALRIQAASVGGTVSDNLIVNPINGSPTSDFNTREDQINETSIDVRPNALLNLSYFF